MGRKGVSKRKTKKSKSFPNENFNGSSKMRPGESPSVQALMKNAGATPAPNRGDMNSVTGSNKKNRKGK